MGTQKRAWGYKRFDLKSLQILFLHLKGDNISCGAFATGEFKDVFTGLVSPLHN